MYTNIIVYSLVWIIVFYNSYLIVIFIHSIVPFNIDIIIYILYTIIYNLY